MMRPAAHTMALASMLTAATVTSGMAAGSLAPIASPPQVIVPPDQCGDDLKIIETTPLQFGVISMEHGAGGVIIISPNGAVATLGGAAAGPDATPATIRLCGLADEEFLMMVEPGQLDIATANVGARPHVVHDLEAIATGAELHPTADGQWQGTLGPRGTAEIRIGGSLTIPASQDDGTFAAPFRIRIDELK